MLSDEGGKSSLSVGHELLVGARLCDPASLHDHDLVDLGEECEGVGDEEASAPPEDARP